MDVFHPENIDPRPKRRKDKDNPYQIFSVGKDSADPHYYVSFVDGQGVTICTEISAEIFYALDQFELDDLSHLNEVDNHYEKGESLDSTLAKRTAMHMESLEDTMHRLLMHEKVHEAIAILSPLQQRRLRLYFFEELTLKEIGEMEGCEYQTVQKSIQKALKKMKLFLE